MTNTKKKIAVEVEVPDGATHYEVVITSDGEHYIDWYKHTDDGGYWWEGMRENWVVAFSEPYTETTIKPIEVIK